MPHDRQATDGAEVAVSHFATRFLRCALAIALLLPAPMFAAGFTCPQTPSSARDESAQVLDEVVVTTGQATTDTKDVLAWLALLPGRYTYEGFVDLCGQGIGEHLRPVTGSADCSRSGSNPNVRCTVNVRWPETRGEDGRPVPGGVSSLVPGLVIFSLEKRHRQIAGGGMAAFRESIRTGIPASPVQTGYWGLTFTQVDSNGVAEWGSGMLVGDTFTSRERCVGIPGACQKTTRITARPQADEIVMTVEISIDSRRVHRQALLLRRGPVHDNSSSGASP